MGASFNSHIDIFLADDDADDRFLFEEALMELRGNVRITTAVNGEQLMSNLDTKTPPNPYIIFLDLNMPLKNGMECLEEIKASSSFQNVPVVIFSTSCQKETMDQVYTKGANYYMCKPDNFQKLKKLLEKVFSLNAASLNNRPARENFIITA
ncbi:MAG: response regulator [Ferruginibacter sp.]